MYVIYNLLFQKIYLNQDCLLKFSAHYSPNAYDIERFSYFYLHRSNFRWKNLFHVCLLFHIFHL